MSNGPCRFHSLLSMEFEKARSCRLYCSRYTSTTLLDLVCGVYIVLYADDILLLSPTVCELQKYLNTCERELDSLDLVINVKNSCCVRVDPRSNVICQRLCSLSGTHLPWMTEIKYLGVHIVSSKSFNVSTEQSGVLFIVLLMLYLAE